MYAKWTLFVEGDSDQAFLKCFLEHLGIVNIDIDVIGGGVSKLPTVAPIIQRGHDAGNRIGVILDANSEPNRRRHEFQQSRNRLQLPVADDCCFLLPNNSAPGCLETLLEQIAVSAHRVIYECFQEYEACLLSRNRSYRLPNPKARIYAYCEALDLETHEKRRDYGDSLHWDLSNASLNPLKEFLSTL
jgi:hypothetical protein